MSRIGNVLDTMERFGDVLKAGEVLGYSAEGVPILQPKTKPAQKKAKQLVKDEAVKFVKDKLGLSENSIFFEPARSLFMRLIFQAKDEKHAKKIMDGYVAAQKIKEPYDRNHKKHGLPFPTPNFSYSGGVLGSAAYMKKLNSGILDPIPNMETKSRIILNVLPKVKEIHTSSDVIAIDLWRKNLSSGTKIYIYYRGKKQGDGTFPSDLRLFKAAERLKKDGHSVETVGEMNARDAAILKKRGEL